LLSLFVGFFEIITVRDETVGCASGRQRQYSPAKNVVARKKEKSHLLTLRILYSVSVLNGRPTDRQTELPTDRPTDRQADRQTDWPTDGPTDW